MNSAKDKTDPAKTSEPKQNKALRDTPIACKDVPASVGSSYPGSFRDAVEGRTKHKLGDFFGLQNFGVNYTILAPGASSSLQHYHTKQDEFIMVLEGTASLYLSSEAGFDEEAVKEFASLNLEELDGLDDDDFDDDDEEDDDTLYKEHRMGPGDCMGFKAGQEVAHYIVNESTTERVVYLEIGDRTPDDVVHYLNADLKAVPDKDHKGKWKFTHRDGTPFE